MLPHPPPGTGHRTWTILPLTHVVYSYLMERGWLTPLPPPATTSRRHAVPGQRSWRSAAHVCMRHRVCAAGPASRLVAPHVLPRPPPQPHSCGARPDQRPPLLASLLAHCGVDANLVSSHLHPVQASRVPVGRHRDSPAAYVCSIAVRT